MDEIRETHSLNLEWGCITNLVNKVGDIEDRIDGGWLELIDMVADAMTDAGKEKDPAKLFFTLYAFMFRLYYRLKTNPEKHEFNRCTYDEKNQVFEIFNYTYTVFKWAVENGYVGGIDNSTVRIPRDKLSTKQAATFERRCRKEA